MEAATANHRRVIVVGGGISGLAAAHRLHELAPALQVTLLEAADKLGGVLQTERVGPYLIERASDSFITNIPWALDLCRRIGLEDQLIGTDESRRKALVVCRGKLQPIPDGFLLLQPKRCWPVMASPILSWRGKLRLACEPWIRRRADLADESLAAFVRRRLGREAFDRLVQPLVGGIYTADPEQLSMAATMGRFQELERRHGSLIRAAWREKSPPHERADSGARYSMFVAPRAGLSSLVSTLAARLPAGSIRLQASAQSIIGGATGDWQVKLASGEELTADAVILATPAPVAAKCLASNTAITTAASPVTRPPNDDIQQELARELAAIPYAGASVIILAARRDQIQTPLTSFGFVVPTIERRRILAGSFASLKFAGRAPDDEVLIRVFVGGALQPELMSLADEQLLALAREELGELIGLKGEPTLAQVHRWRGAMPQYHVGHVDRVRRIESLASRLPGLELAGNAYHGVGIPQCVHSGELAAERIIGLLQSEQPLANGS